MAGFSEQLDALTGQGAKVIAASVDDEEKAKEVADTLGFPIAYGVTRAEADALGSWWEDRRGIIQPSEFLLDGEGRVLQAMYATGPIGRISPDDAVRMVTNLERRRQEQG